MTESLFGKIYNVVGESSSSLLLKSNGTVKVLWGNKFIDLVKNGKINNNSEINSIFFKINNESEFKENGIYLLNELVYVYINGNKVLLNSSELSYISFTIDLELNSEEKERALTNIGFYYNTLEDVKNSEITSGIVYVKNDNKLYTIIDSTISEYIISNSTTLGLLNNTLMSDDFLKFIISNKQILVLDINGINTNSDIIITNGNYIKSTNASENYGFRLYNSDSSGSVLEIDNIIVRKSIIYDNFKDISHNELYTLYSNKNVEFNTPYRIKDFKNTLNILNEDIEDELTDSKNIFPIIITFKSYDTYECYFEEDPSLSILYDITPRNININNNTYTSRGDIIYLEDIYGNKANFDFKHIVFYYNNSPYYLFSNTNGEEYSINYRDNNININNILILTFLNNQLVTIEGANYLIFTVPSNNVNFRNLNSCAFINQQFNNNEVFNNWENVVLNSAITNCLFKLNVSNITINKAVDLCIFYHEVDNTNLFDYLFNNCEFRSAIKNNIELPDLAIITVLSNDELKQVSVYLEGLLYKLRVLADSITTIPSGTIVMWHGAEIPYGWAICDGLNGTPNLIGKFIKASTNVGDIESSLNENNELTLTVDNLPKHSHPHLSHTHSITVDDISGNTNSSGSLTLNFNSSDYINSVTTETATVINGVTHEGAETTTKDVVSSVSSLSKGGSVSGGSHSHSFSISNITASCSNSTSTELDGIEWKNKPIKIEPRAYALIFIMKL